tara:strand:- start:256 stop:657 length:402 start_codon:yes stop_codon:yes gene_type:complete
MLYPMFMLVMLSYVVLLITVRVRMGAVREGNLPLSYFSLMQGQDVPEMVAKTSRQLSNLFEMPVLFYVGGLLYIALDMTGTFPIVCAWAFVVTPIVHTCIHLSYNNVLHRLLVFGFGNLCVLAMWISIVSAAQ